MVVRQVARRRNHSAQAAKRLPSLLFWRAGVSGRPWLDVALLAALVAVLAISRWLAFPASIWDQDEAYFALGVLDFDPMHNQPHPPFFPLWIALGKVVRFLAPALEPEVALQLVGWVFSVWILFPLVALWSLLLPRAQALAAACLYLSLPGSWLLAGRAYSEPTATALLVGALALWLRPDLQSRHLLKGGLLAAGCLLVRPQWAVPALLLTGWRTFTVHGWRRRSATVVPLLASAAAAALVVMQQAGGTGAAMAAIRAHGRYYLAALAGSGWEYADLAVNRAAGGWPAGTVWMLLAAAGTISALRRRGPRSAAVPLLCLALAPLLLQLILIQNPTLPRFALPVMALSCGLVVAGGSSLLRHDAVVVGLVGLWALINAISVVPALPEYRTRPAPAVAAMEALSDPRLGDPVVVDRTLAGFVALSRHRGRLPHQLIWDYEAELGWFSAARAPGLLALYAGEPKAWIESPRMNLRFSTEHPLLRLVASPRFHDVTVVVGCAIRKPEQPSITEEMLRPGAILPPP